MTADERRSDWDKHKNAVYQFHTNTEKKFDRLDKTNEKQYKKLDDINTSIGDMRGDLKVFRVKIYGLSAAVSAIVAFVSRHLG